MEGKCSRTSSSIERPVTTQARSGAMSGATRASVSCIILLPLGSGRNCLGKPGVLSGHKRVPLPPARITACKCFISQFLTSYFVSHEPYSILASSHPQCKDCIEVSVLCQIGLHLNQVQKDILRWSDGHKY